MMKKNLILVIGILFLIHLGYTGRVQAHDSPGEPQSLRAAARPPWAAIDQQKLTDANAMGLVISNFGAFGNNLVTRAPSMEYPLGSAIEHLIRAGLWIGAVNADNDTVVSVGSDWGYWGQQSEGVSEFWPLEKIRERSILITSRHYDTLAVSEQDLITRYTDCCPRRADNEGELEVTVTQTAYVWSYEFAEAFVILSFSIKNTGWGILDKIYLGIFSELCSGWKDAYDTWRPPSNAWFRKKALEYFPKFRMCGEHHYNYQRGKAPSWGAISILGTQNTTPIDQVYVSFNWWDWYDERDDRMNDKRRYEMMSNHQVDDTYDIIPDADDPIELISAGPFPAIARGESLVFVCAFVGGMDRESLLDNAQWAQNAFDHDYVLPSPPQPPRFKVKPSKGAITLYWDDYPEDKEDPFYEIPDFEGYRVYLTRKEGATSEDFELVRELDIIDGIGYDTGLESVADSIVWEEGDTTLYSLKIDNLKDGFRYWIAITSYDKGVPEEGVKSMERGVHATKTLAIPGPAPAQDQQKIFVVPNPYRGEAVWDGVRDKQKYIWFVNVPQRATIRIYTLAGDLVKTIEYDGSIDSALDVGGIQYDSDRTAMPGGLCAWDLISDRDQAIASGLYLFSVENKDTGSNQIGKFLIIR